ncbi:MAG: ADP-ribosylglycohydrolase family protein [Thermomicrobiales bacterium]
MLGLPELHSRRAPGNTCLASLRGGRAGSVGEKLNSSKGCGGVMRAAPVGLAWPRDPGAAFEQGCESAALTHGHRSGFLSAGFLAATISGIVAGRELGEAIGVARGLLVARSAHRECLGAVDGAVRLAREGAEVHEAIGQLGEGWVGEEALAIALFCALTAEDFADGVIKAVNHSGDSDSTGAIAGNLLGALLGEGAIPARWLERLELRGAIGAVAGDLYRHFGNSDVATLSALERDEADWERYPGW